MLTRAVSAVLLLVLVAGCAGNAGSGSGSGDQAGGAPAPAPSSSDVIDLPLPSTESSSGKQAGAGAQTITGVVTAGVEPNCLVLTADGAAYQLVFDDPAMRDEAPAGQKVTVVGRAEPTMMSTCQQGVPFMVSAVRGG